MGLHHVAQDGPQDMCIIFSQDTFVNLGARSGLDDDPLQFLVSNPLHVEFALAAEMDPEFLRGRCGILPKGDEGNALDIPERGSLHRSMISMLSGLHWFLQCEDGRKEHKRLGHDRRPTR